MNIMHMICQLCTTHFKSSLYQVLRVSARVHGWLENLIEVIGHYFAVFVFIDLFRFNGHVFL